MKKAENYRYEVETSLKILRNRRDKFVNDSICREPELYLGLHESERSAVRDLRFQYYITIWLNEHWNDMADEINGSTELSSYDKKAFTMFFAEYFSHLVDHCSEKGLLTKLAAPEFLDIQKRQLKELLNSTLKWEENSNILKLQAQKNKEKFKRLINENRT